MTNINPFLLKEKDIEYWTVAGNERVRVQLKLVRDGLESQGVGEASEPISAATIAVEQALERWFDKGHVALLHRLTLNKPQEGSNPRMLLFHVYTFARMGDEESAGLYTHPDPVKAAALGYVGVINRILTLTDRLQAASGETTGGHARPFPPVTM